MTAPSADPLPSYSTRTSLPVLRSRALKRCVEVAMRVSAAARRCRMLSLAARAVPGEGARGMLAAAAPLVPRWLVTATSSPRLPRCLSVSSSLDPHAPCPSIFSFCLPAIAEHLRTLPQPRASSFLVSLGRAPACWAHSRARALSAVTCGLRIVCVRGWRARLRLWSSPARPFRSDDGNSEQA